ATRTPNRTVVCRWTRRKLAKNIWVPRQVEQPDVLSDGRPSGHRHVAAIGRKRWSQTWSRRPSRFPPRTVKPYQLGISRRTRAVRDGSRNGRRKPHYSFRHANGISAEFHRRQIKVLGKQIGVAEEKQLTGQCIIRSLCVNQARRFRP